MWKRIRLIIVALNSKKVYHFVGSLESHDVDGIGSDADEQNPHAVEVHRAPVVLQDQVRISCQKDDEVELLRFVGEPYDVFISEYFEEQHEDGDEMEKISN